MKKAIFIVFYAILIMVGISSGAIRASAETTVGMWYSTWYAKAPAINTTWTTGFGSISTNQFIGDVNGDGKEDGVTFTSSTGAWNVALSNGNGFNTSSTWITGLGTGSNNQFLADVNGDGKKDAVVYIASSGIWNVSLSNGSGFQAASQWMTGHGVGSNNQLMGDVNGDGKEDSIVYFASNGNWYVALSSGSGFQAYTLWTTGHGVGSNNQFLGDVNGDGKKDAIVYFSSGGSWYSALSTGSGFQVYSLWTTGHGSGSNAQLVIDGNGNGFAAAFVFFNGDVNGDTKSGDWYGRTYDKRTQSLGGDTVMNSGFGNSATKVFQGNVTGDKYGWKASVAFFASTGTWKVEPYHFFKQNLYDTWTAWNIKYNPLTLGSYQQYDSDNTAVIDEHLSTISAAKVDFLLFDQTNNIYVDDEYIFQRAKTTASRIKTWNSNVNNRNIKYAISIGGNQWTHDPLTMEFEAGEVWNQFVNTVNGGATNYYNLNAKPLLVIYASAADRASWENWTGNKTNTNHFTIRWAISPAAAGNYGWEVRTGTIDNDEVMVVMPGWNNHQGVTPVSRSNGDYYSLSGWENVMLKTPKPQIVIINSFNEYAEETAVAVTDTANVVSPTEKWYNKGGLLDNSMYWNMTKNYINQLNNPGYVASIAPIVVPSLKEWTSAAGELSITSSSRICVDSVYNTQLTDTANTLKGDILAMTGLTLNIVTSASPQAGDIFLTLNNTDNGIGTEGYIMQVGTYVTIKANSSKGVFYGTRTALQILKQSPNKASLPKGTARDYPTYKERAFMLDVARKYFTVSFIQDYIKFLAWHKLSDLHIHFTDDSAFRLVSTTYPGLAAAQSYTHADIAAILATAQKYNVTVTPEIDLPGHAKAITNYMPSIANQTWSDVLDLSNPQTFTFVDNILNEFIPLFDAPEFVLGTDETPNDGRGGIPYFDRNVDMDIKTHNYALSLGYSTAGELYRKFINDYNTFIKNKGKKTRIWSWFDSLPGTTPISNDITFDAWLANDIASISQRGFNIINSSAQNLYSVPGTGWQPYNNGLYQSWQPYSFDSFGTSAQLSPTDSHILGAKFNNWNDQSVALGFTEQEIDKVVSPPLRILSEITWGGPRADGGYPEFLDRMMLVGEAPGLTTIGGQPSINLALTRSMSVSSYVPSAVPTGAFDGAAATRWSSAEGSDPQWIYVDLGAPSNINRVNLNWEAAYATSYKIQVSNDSTNWTDVYTTTTGNGGIDNISFPTKIARYVRMYGTQRATAWGYSLWEFGVYYDLPTGTNFAANKPATASSIYPTFNVPAYVSDGNEMTRWSSIQGIDPQWIYVDLGQTRNISRVRLNWENAYASVYKIQTSNDKLTWTDVYSTTTGDGGIDDINFTSTSAKYVRMYGTQRAGTWGYSLYELAVY